MPPNAVCSVSMNARVFAGMRLRPGNTADTVWLGRHHLKNVLGFLGMTDVRLIYAEGLAMGIDAAEHGFAQARRISKRRSPDLFSRFVCLGAVRFIALARGSDPVQ
jgi:hypothetical protein